MLIQSQTVIVVEVDNIFSPINLLIKSTSIKLQKIMLLSSEKQKK
jgi:hypothetical protein